MPFHLPPLTPVDAGILLWLAAVGAAIGSFLNVVVYRLPRGQSLVHPGSRCPSCRHPIRWYDNIPIGSWLLLRGRCRDCGAPIAVQYPAVEAAVALLFALIGYLTVVGHGANLPDRPELVGAESAVVIYPPRSAETVVGIAVVHLLLLSTLLAAALIEVSGRDSPARLFLPVLAVGTVFPLMWPELRPAALFAPWMEDRSAHGEMALPAHDGGGDLAAQPTGSRAAAWRHYPGLIEGLAGLAAGAVIGAITRLVPSRWGNSGEQLPPAPVPGGKDSGPLLGSMAVGATLGWQAALLAGSAALAGLLAVAMLTRPWPRLAQATPSTWLLTTTLLFLVFWRPIHALLALLLGTGAAEG